MTKGYLVLCVMPVPVSSVENLIHAALPMSARMSTITIHSALARLRQNRRKEVGNEEDGSQVPQELTLYSWAESRIYA